MNTRITLRAEGVEVTASEESQALSHLREDGAEFKASWNYVLIDAEETDDDPDENGECRIEATTSGPDVDDGSETTWTGEVDVVVVLAGRVPEDEAKAAAIAALRN